MAELLAAARYYEEQAENLGSDSVAAVERTCDRLADLPAALSSEGSS